ncbi:MAG: GNAT family N-acetyltransferase [Neobacillus sp.]
MRVEALECSRVADFVAFCKRHRAELDDSFLYDEDLKGFEANEENPTYIVMNDQGRIVAAASLIMDEYFKRGRKARFRIFYSEVDELKYYQMLLDAVLKYTADVDKVFLFVPLVNESLIDSMKDLDFISERYTFLLVREAEDEPAINLPEGYEIRSFIPRQDEETWCQVRNASFAKLRGSETPITPEMVTKMTKEEDYLNGGMMILYHHKRAVGVVRGADDEYENAPIMNIGPVAVIPEYQGRGLGRCLLRAALHFAKEQSYQRTVLCVNAENERAKALYIQEGFKQVEAVVCMERSCHRVLD